MRKLAQQGRLEEERILDRVGTTLCWAAVGRLPSSRNIYMLLVLLSGFLYEQYKSKYLYWETVETLRKLYFVSVAVFILESGFQIFLSIFVSIIALCAQIYTQPFREPLMNSTVFCGVSFVFVSQLSL